MQNCVNSAYSVRLGDMVYRVIIKKLLDSVFNILPVFIHQWEVQTQWVYTFSPYGKGYVWMMI
jgi:hypothetical protein